MELKSVTRITTNSYVPPSFRRFKAMCSKAFSGVDRA